MKRIATTAAVLLLALAAPASASTAQHSYQRIWHQDRFALAPGMPAPIVVFNTPTPGAQADTVFPKGSPRYIEVSPGVSRGLRRGAEGAREVIEWELTRVFGSYDQGVYFPMPVTNALRRYRNGFGSPVPVAQSRLPFWGQDPQSVFDH